MIRQQVQLSVKKERQSTLLYMRWTAVENHFLRSFLDWFKKSERNCSLSHVRELNPHIHHAWLPFL